MGTQKIFGVGLNKTGTTSLKLALEALGYRHLGRKPRLFKFWKQGKFDEIFEWIEDYQSFEDWPWPLMVPELLERYPDALFILTRRGNGTKWVESLKRHSEKTNPDQNPRLHIFGHPYPHGFEEEHLSFYEAHLKKVRAAFQGRRSQFIELCWEEGDGWEELCGFLGKKVPKRDFPHANQSRLADADPEFLYENQRRIQKQLKNLKEI